MSVTVFYSIFIRCLTANVLGDAIMIFYVTWEFGGKTLTFITNVKITKKKNSFTTTSTEQIKILKTNANLI